MAQPPVGSPLSIHDPDVVGPWTLRSRLGAGGMGVVYYATRADSATAAEDTGAAVKVIRPGLLDVPANLERFGREASILRSVNDVHISKFLACDLTSEPAWLAVEYVSGPVLRDAIDLAGPLLTEDWWELAAGIAQALAVLEVHRITHRDLKPANVILNQRGPVLIDFGIAHPEDATQLTATGLVTGSPAWLSPEQANLSPTGPASDIFALGSLLAYAATGRPPFGTGSGVAILVAITTKEPDLAGIDPIRTHLLRAMLTKSPDQRPTALEVLRLARARGAATAALRPAGDATLVAPTDRVVTEAAQDGPDLDTPLPAGLGGPPTQAGTTASRPAAPTSSASESADQLTQSRSRVSRPRTAADAATIAARRRRMLVVASIVLIGIIAWLGLRAAGILGSGNGPGIVGQVIAPSAPASDQLGDGDWFLDSYRLSNTADGHLTLDGQVRNRGSRTASADLRVWIYLQTGELLGRVESSVADVAAGQSVATTMSGDAIFQSGPKVVLFQTR